MPDAGSTAIARFLTFLDRTTSRVIPLAVANSVSLPVADAVCALMPGKREIALRNYARVLGRSADDPIVARTVRECFRHYGRYAAEILHLQGWGTEDVLDRVDVDGAEYLDEAAAQGRGVIFVSGHMGSTEVAASLVVLRGFRITSVAERLRPAWLMDYVVESRRRMGITLMPATGAGVSLIRILRKGGMVALVVDAGVDGIASVPVTLFGAEASFPEGPARLARLTGAPIVFGMAGRLRGGRYAAHLCQPITSNRELSADADVAEMTQKIATTFESFVRRYPGQWYAFRDIWAPRPA